MVRMATIFQSPAFSSSGDYMVCPYHQVRLEERKSQKGWEYVKSPMYPYLLFCPKEKLVSDMREVYHQPQADVHNMWSCLSCFCHEPATLQQSHSQDSPRRLFLTCSKTKCKFFRWADKPLGKDCCCKNKKVQSEKKTMESVLMRYAWKHLWDVMRWNCHQTLCTFLYDHQKGEKEPIPTECNEDTHPLKVFEKTHVETYVYRWEVFVLWLKQHPLALGWFRIIQKAHPHNVPTIQTLWDCCWKVRHLERQKERQHPSQSSGSPVTTIPEPKAV